MFCGSVGTAREPLGKALCGGAMRSVCHLCARIVKTACAADLSRARLCVHLTAMEIERLCVGEKRVSGAFGSRTVRTVVDLFDPASGLPVQGLAQINGTMEARFGRGAYRAVCGCAACVGRRGAK